MDTLEIQNALFEGLSFTDIFIGDNGLTVIVASMLVALFGNLFKKYRRFIAVVDGEKDFNLRYWLVDNSFSMIAGFFITYFAVRLLNVFTPIVMNLEIVKQYIPDSASLHVSELLIVVSLIIGYYVDSFEPKIPMRKLLKNQDQKEEPTDG